MTKLMDPQIKDSTIYCCLFCCDSVTFEFRCGVLLCVQFFGLFSFRVFLVGFSMASLPPSPSLPPSSPPPLPSPPLSTPSSLPDQSHTRTSKCMCGQLCVVIQGKPVRVSMCHCFACQKRTGSVFSVQARFHTHQIVEERGERATYTRVGDSGWEIVHTFCPVCGSTVWYRFM